jgi:hypothetical protein
MRLVGSNVSVRAVPVVLRVGNVPVVVEPLTARAVPVEDSVLVVVVALVALAAAVEAGPAAEV